MDTVDTGESSGHVGETRHLSELRTVLLGAEESGKSSAGNTILGKQEFTPGVKTPTCKKVQANVAGRQVTVVDTPGWVGYFPAEFSPELLKDQIAFSVSLCPPGPHAVLLVINLGSSFQEEHRRAVQEHLELLSDTVWRHTILLFTSGDSLREITIEQHIEREGQALQWVIKKCGNRYHVLSSKKRSEVSQVSELLEMIEKMVAGNGGRHFHIERKVLQDMEEKRRSTEKRANRRVRHVLEHRETLRDLLKGGTSRPSELRVVLLGWVAGGKSLTGNTILGRKEFGVWKRIKQCEKKQGEVAGRQVTVVNTPGWWKFMPAELTPNWIKEEVLKSFTLCHPGPHVILLVIPADTSFKEEQRKIVLDNMKHLGERVWGHTLVLFTWGEYLGNSSIEQHIEREGHALQWLIEKCGNRYHVLCNMKKEDRTQVTELLEKIEEMVAGKTIFHLKTQCEVKEEIEEIDQATTGVDLSKEKQKITEQMQIIDELWMKREEHLLEKLGLDKRRDSAGETQQHDRRRSKGLHPDNFQRIFEKERSIEESAMKSRSVRALGEEEQKKSTDRTIQETEGRATENDHVVEKERRREVYSVMQEQTTPSERRRCIVTEEREAGWGSAGVELNAQEDTEGEAQTAPWTTEQSLAFLHNEIKLIFEKEWSRKEDMINKKVRTEVKSYITPPAKGTSMDDPFTNLTGVTSSEPDTSDIATSCIKVCDWLKENHSGNSAAVSGHECSEMSKKAQSTETSDITGRDEELEHCGTVTNVI
ncbi:GTPase IMAP family member 8-like [Anguilla anguilla]|uniref:GTPase IMAP family member 8-like n=1 Tax=Anguilla anguilla TaxID=7936 RepID=UPI0015AF6502|nr:GTPase IMAP family member 8-like [Anguilla anguilla]